MPDNDINVLRLILHELRAQRGGGADFAYTKMIAVILQMLALVCFIVALMSGDDTGLFLRLVLSSVMIQLVTIAILLFGK